MLTVLGIFVAAVTVGIILFCLAILATQAITKKKIFVKSIFRDFNQKIWMTVGLGCSFFGFYLIMVLLGSYLLNGEVKKNLFLLVYKNPTVFIYLGLLVFVCISVIIIFARSLIKYLYNSKKQ